MSDEHYCPRCNAPFLCFNGVNTRHFKCGSSTHIPSVACGYASQLQDRIKRLEEELERTKQDRNAIAKKTREPLLLKLDRAAERIKRLEEAGDAVEERLGCGCGCGGPCRVCQSASGNWFEAKEAKP